LVALTFGGRGRRRGGARGAHDQATTADAIAVLGAAQYNVPPVARVPRAIDHAAAL